MEGRVLSGCQCFAGIQGSGLPRTRGHSPVNSLAGSRDLRPFTFWGSPIFLLQAPLKLTFGRGAKRQCVCSRFFNSIRVVVSQN